MLLYLTVSPLIDLAQSWQHDPCQPDPLGFREINGYDNGVAGCGRGWKDWWYETCFAVK